MIGGRKGESVEFPRAYPSIIIDSNEPDWSSPISAFEGMEGDPEVGIGMIHRGQVNTHLDIDSELLHDLPFHATHQVLARFELSPRKLPESPQEPFRRTPRDQEPVFPPDDPGRDLIMGYGLPR
jgi:hypothetical protein